MTWALGALTLALAALAALLVGPAGNLPASALLSGGDGLTDVQRTILFQLRLPRMVLGALVGATLSLAGAGYQGVFRNPLADPYLLGAAAGAGLGATAWIAAAGGPGSVMPAAFLGALGGVVVTYTIGRSAGDRSTGSLVLAGVAVASFLTAAQTFILQRNSDTLREVYAFVLGRLSTSGWKEVRLVLPYVSASVLVILLHRRLLDVLSVGEDEAASLGVHTARVRLWVVVAASLGTAAAVAVSGLIGFVGIIVPHTVRLLAGWSYRVILPLSVIFGA
jgi:iron complex transport system permease protein